MTTTTIASWPYIDNLCPDPDVIYSGASVDETESLLQDIYSLASAVTSKAISRRLTHETCERIRELAQKARAELDKE